MAAIDVNTLLPQTRQCIETVIQDPWGALRTVHPIEAGLLLVIGLAFLLYGFRIYKVLVILAYAIVGTFLGAMLATAMNFNPLIGMIGGALVLAILAWPLYLIGWGLLGGGFFAGLGAMVAGLLTTSTVYIAIAAVGGGVLGIVLTILLMRPLIIFITSVLGSACLIEGAVALTLLAPSLGDPVLQKLQATPLLQAGLVAVPAFIGIYMQLTDSSGKIGGKKKSKPKDDGEDKKK
jgi:hypothetical protein